MTNEKLETKIRKAETEQASKVDASRKQYGQYMAMVPAVVTEYDKAAGLPQTIRNSWVSLDDTYRAEDLVIANAAVERAKIRAVGLREYLRRARLGIRGTDTHLAEIAAKVIERAMPGVATVTTFAEASATPKTAELPLAVISQTALTQRTDSGHEVGEVTVAYHYSTIHNGMASERDLEQAAQDLGYDVRIVRRNEGGATLRVVATPETPYIAEPDLSHAGRLSWLIAGSVIEHLAGANGVRQDLELRYAETYAACAVAGLCTVSRDLSEDETQWITTIDAEFYVEPTGVSYEVVDRAVESVVESRKGILLSGVGRIEAVELTKEDWSKEGHRTMRDAQGKIGGPRRQTGDVAYDEGVSAVTTWRVQTTLTSAVERPEAILNADEDNAVLLDRLDQIAGKNR